MTPILPLASLPVQSLAETIRRAVTPVVLLLQGVQLGDPTLLCC